MVAVNGKSIRFGWGSLRFAAAVLACLSLGSLLPGCDADPGVSALYRQATLAAGAADFDTALSLTEKALQAEPDHVRALVLHGYCRFRLMTPTQMAEDASPVVTYMERAARLAPDDFTTQYYHGWMLLESGQYGRALDPLEKAYELREQCPEHLDSVLVMLSLCCLNQNLIRGRTYLQALRRYRGFEGSPLVYNALGILYAKQLDYESALTSFLEALERDPNHPVVLRNLAVLHDQFLQRPDEAMRYYARAIAAGQATRDTSREEAIRRRLRTLAEERRRPARNRP